MDKAMQDAFHVPADPFHILSEAGTLKHFHSAWRWRTITHKVGTVESLMKVIYYAIVIGMVGWLAAQFLDYRHPVRANLSVISEQVSAGSDLEVRFTDIYRSRVCDATLSWVIWDGRNRIETFSAEKVKGVGEVGPVSDFTKGFWIPDHMTPGPARLRLTRSYSCPDNYVHDITWADPVINFTILPSAK